MNDKKSILYSGVVLTGDSRKLLLDKLKKHIPKNFEPIAHHMTIGFRTGLDAMGLADDEGKSVKLVATHIGATENVVAVKVAGYHSLNSTAHITLAVKSLGNSVESNKISVWKPIKPITMSGIVSEIYI